MDLSILFGQVFGIYMVVAGAAMLMRRAELTSTVREFISSKADMFFFGAMALLLGLFIVLQHNVWDGTWRVWITLMGWGALVKGVSAMLFPSFLKSMSKMLTKPGVYTLAGVLWVAVGAYLVYQTFPM